MVLFGLRKLVLQTHICSHPVGLDVWFLVRPFVYFHTSCVRTVKALVRLHGCAGSPEPSLVAYVISTVISWAGSIISLAMPAWLHWFISKMFWLWMRLDVWTYCSVKKGLVIENNNDFIISLNYYSKYWKSPFLKHSLMPKQSDAMIKGLCALRAKNGPPLK